MAVVNRNDIINPMVTSLKTHFDALDPKLIADVFNHVSEDIFNQSPFIAVTPTSSARESNEWLVGSLENSFLITIFIFVRIPDNDFNPGIIPEVRLNDIEKEVYEWIIANNTHANWSNLFTSNDLPSTIFPASYDDSIVKHLVEPITVTVQVF